MTTTTMPIKDLLKRDLNEKIEEIIKVDQADEETVYRELTEYVATDRIRDHYRTLLKAMADAPANPHEGVGIWISGFFGSGKSSFAKNLGYVLGNQDVLGRHAADLFKAQLDDAEVSQLVDYITTRIPTEVVMFDISVNRAMRDSNQKVADILYMVLLRRLGYAQDFDIAELEIELEADGKLERFEQVCLERNGKPWPEVRLLSTRMSQASAILHALDPATFPSADAWARAHRPASVTVASVVERTFELMARRRPDKALTFIIDEVGQYVARSAEKIEDLRATVEQFGKESRNRVRARKAIAPVWIAVTSQEKLDEVVAALDSRRVELAKVQDRFTYRVDLAPADIREVATRRVLGKRPDAEPTLRALFNATQGQINTACKLEHTARRSEVRPDEFAQFYPYLPHYIELSIDIMSGIRIQPGAPRHLGGSNRTIIKQAHEMLISPRTRMAQRPVGALVTLDLIYELVEGNLSSEKQKDISDIAERFKNEPGDGGWAMRVAKAICLLEFVRDLPRTEHNIAAVLVDVAGESAPQPQVRAALERLEQAQFIRHTNDGWKLQTAQEKRWDSERKEYLDPKPVARNEIKRAMLTEIFGDAALRNYRHPKTQKTFGVGVSVDGARLTQGAIPLALAAADDASDQRARLDETRTASRERAHENEVYWVFALDDEIDNLIAEAYASNQMIAKYEQRGAQGERAEEIAPLVATERDERESLKRRLRERLEGALAMGAGVFRGVTYDASTLGRTLAECLHKLFGDAVPQLYPKLELGSRKLTGNEADDVLKAANLSALPQVFYGGDQGLGLVIKDGPKYVVNTSAEIAQELLGFLNGKQRYGERVTGKDLEQHFSGIGYGWDLDVLKLTLATLLRAGAIEVTSQGKRFRNAQDPQCRAPLTSNPAFRNASFAPRESIDLRMLTTAVRAFEELTGDEVDVEEGAIAEALKRLAGDEMRQVLPARAEARANDLPGADTLDEYTQTLTNIQNSASDDCVLILANQGATLRELRQRAGRIRTALASGAARAIQRARLILREQWPLVERSAAGAQLASDAEALAAALKSADLYDHLPRAESLASSIAGAYATRYGAQHRARYERYSRALDDVRNRPEWEQAPHAARVALIEPLTTRQCQEEADLSDGATVCQRCSATLTQIESDLAALAEYTAQALARLDELVAPPPAPGAAPRPTTQRIRAASYFVEPLDSEEAIKKALERLGDELRKLLDQGVRVIVE